MRPIEETIHMILEGKPLILEGFLEKIEDLGDSLSAKNAKKFHDILNKYIGKGSKNNYVSIEKGLKALKSSEQKKLWVELQKLKEEKTIDIVIDSISEYAKENEIDKITNICEKLKTLEKYERKHIKWISETSKVMFGEE